MTIRTKEPDIPNEFPPARLFLDDIEEIVRTLGEFIESRKIDIHATAEDPTTKVSLSAGGEASEESDDIQDLAKIARNYRELRVSVSKGGWLGVGISLRFHPWYFTLWQSWGLTKEDTWSAFRKLDAISRKESATGARCSVPFRTGLFGFFGSAA